MEEKINELISELSREQPDFFLCRKLIQSLCVEPKPCSFCGKVDIRTIKGLCRNCYQRYWKRGTPEYFQPNQPKPQRELPRICTFCGDTEHYYAKGLCGKCYARNRKKGTPEYAAKLPRICTFCGDTEHYYARGFCKNCYARNLKNGTPEYFQPTPKKEKPAWYEVLYKDVFGEPIELPEDYLAAISAACETLAPREAGVIDSRYKGRKTLSAIGDEMGITRERVRQIQNKALQKLRKRCADLLRYGVAETKRKSELEEQRRKEADEAAREAIRSRIPDGVAIEELGLSVRSYNCLARKGLKTLMDVALFDNSQELGLMCLCHFGRKSYEEVANILLEYGLTPKLSQQAEQGQEASNGTS